MRKELNHFEVCIFELNTFIANDKVTENQQPFWRIQNMYSHQLLLNSLISPTLAGVEQVRSRWSDVHCTSLFNWIGIVISLVIISKFRNYFIKVQHPQITSFLPTFLLPP